MATFEHLAVGQRWAISWCRSESGRWERNGITKPWLWFDVTRCERGAVYWLLLGNYALALVMGRRQ